MRTKTPQWQASRLLNSSKLIFIRDRGKVHFLLLFPDRAKHLKQTVLIEKSCPVTAQSIFSHVFSLNNVYYSVFCSYILITVQTMRKKKGRQSPECLEICISKISILVLTSTNLVLNFSVFLKTVLH